MPIYEYRCGNGHAFEVFQSMSDEPVSVCIECGSEAERVLSAPAVHFKGSGFYTTDYARKGAKKPATDAASGSSSEGDPASKTDSGEKKPSEKPSTGSKSGD